MTQPNVDFRSELAGQAAALRSLATRLVSRDDAEDLTHDAMVTALSQRSPPRRVRPWLRQVLRNEAKARRRGTLRRAACEQRAVMHEDAVGPDAAAEHAQMAHAVRDALVALDSAYRRVLEARFYDERTAADIARSEGCPAGTVRWRVQEGLRRMRSVEQFPVSADGRIDANVHLDGIIVDRVTVTSKSAADADLAQCLRESLPGSEANVGEDGLQANELNLALVADVAKVPEDVDAPTPLEMADDGLLPTRAEGDAPVRTIVACSDYECPFCERARATVDQVLDEYPDVRVAWMHDPLPVHEGAKVAARAASAAQAQGKFWDMHDLLFEHADAHSEDDVLGFARSLDLDIKRFEEDFAAADEVVELQRKSCEAAGAKGTPSFFIGDTVLVGAQPIEAFRDALD